MPKRNPVRGELHTHSTFSDGAFAPTEVARRCAEAEVDVWALTDHDTCAGCAEAATAAQDLGIAFIPGIEVSAFLDRSIHVLGYGVDPDSAPIREYSEKRLAMRDSRMERIVDKLAELGVPVDVDRVRVIAGEGAIARPHIAKALVEAGHVASVQEAFDRFIANGGPAYLETPWPQVEDAIALIHRAGGIAVLAHPGVYDRDSAIAGWREAGLDGIEVIHPKHDAAAQRRYGGIAAEFDLLPTGSSDYHGPGHDGEELFGRVPLPDGWLSRLRERLAGTSASW